MRGEFVKKLRPTVYVEPDVIMTGAYNLTPEECTEFESEAVVYSYEDNSLSEQYAAMKHSEKVESPVFEDEQKTEEARRVDVYNGNLFVAPIELSPSSESANESYAYLTHPYENKEPITRAEGCVDFTWNRDTAKRFEGELYISPSPDQIERGEFVKKLRPTTAAAIVMSGEYNLNPEESTEFESDAVVYSYEEDHSLSEQYAKMKHSEEVESPVFEEESTAEAKEQSEVQKCKYCPNGQAIDGADHDSAYSTLMLTSASKNITEEAYQKLWLLEDVVINQTEEDVQASAKEEESNVYSGNLFVSPIEMSPSSESANESYSYLTHPYGNPEYADFSARKLPPFTEFEFDLPKKKEPITRAEGCVEFTWNKDTAVRGEGERYIEPTEEMKKRGEFVAHLSPVKAPEKIDTVGPAYEELALPQNVSEGEEDKESSAALLDTDGTENIVKYVADSAVDANADTNDAYYSLMGMAGKTKPAEPISFSQEFTSILQLEMNSALSLGYELTIARITSNYVDSIMALDFEALAFKESDDRACIIFQCQTKAEAGELVSMIKEAIGDKSLKVKMAELKGRNITPDAFSKEIMK